MEETRRSVGASVRVHPAAGASSGVVVRVEGSLTLDTTAPLWESLDGVVGEAGSRASGIDVSGVADCDTAGAAYLAVLRRRAGSGGARAPLVGARAQVASIVDLVEDAHLGPPPSLPADPDETLFHKVGERALLLVRDARGVFAYVGDLVAGLGAAVTGRGALRWNDTLLYMQRAGADALGIVALINFLMGVILAYQGVAMLGDLGFESYTPDAVAVSVILELGPLMTAIIVAGRSGAAFAAEIGTMKVNEEVDALDTMGLDRTRFLVVPKVAALLLMMPLLVVFADACGVLGGLAICATQLDMPITQYLNAAFSRVDLWGACQGLIKGEAYALCIAGTGCLRGLRTQTGAQGVGLATTSAVVTSILLIIVADAALTMVFQHVGP